MRWLAVADVCYSSKVRLLPSQQCRRQTTQPSLKQYTEELRIHEEYFIETLHKEVDKAVEGS